MLRKVEEYMSIIGDMEDRKKTPVKFLEMKNTVF